MAVDNQIMDSDYKQDLLDILYTKSFLYDPNKGFTLSSGVKSDVYIDVKKTVLCSIGMELVGYAFYQEFKNEPIDAIGGLTLGADPIAVVTALVSSLRNRYLDAFIVRKEPKKHGTERWIEGSLQPGASVIVIDDVVTSGASIITAIERVREAGYNVRRSWALVDREEGGRDNIQDTAKCKFDAIYTKSDFLEFHKEQSK